MMLLRGWNVRLRLLHLPNNININPLWITEDFLQAQFNGPRLILVCRDRHVRHLL